MSTRRLAVIDLGTNAARLLVADVSEDGSWSPVAERRIACRLGEQLGQTGRIRHAAERRTGIALASLGERARRAGAQRLRVIATHALRAAANARDCRRRLETRTGLRILVLSGADEARLVFAAARRWVVPEPGRSLVTLDLGGGSLELARDTPAGPRVLSMPLGAVIGAAAIPPAPAAPPRAIAGLRAAVAALLRRQAADFEAAAPQPAAAGGTVTSTARLLGIPEPLSGRRIGSADVGDVLRRVARLDLASRRRLPGIADRADIVVPALAVLCETLRHLGASNLVVLEYGLREGAIVAMHRDELPEPGAFTDDPGRD
ncbi:MAG: Ppx/GppA phosphatase family protein [Candidatus Krumholzibacteriia bacterium]